MPADRFSVYNRGMVVVLAEQRLMDMRIANSPYMKKEGRENLIDDIQSAVRAANPPVAQPMTPELLERVLGG